MCVTTTRAIKESSVKSRDVPDCTNSIVVAEVNATQMCDSVTCYVSFTSINFQRLKPYNAQPTITT